MPISYRYPRRAAALLLATVLGALCATVPAHAHAPAPSPSDPRRVTIDEPRGMTSHGASIAVDWSYLINVKSGLAMAVSGGQDGNGVPIIQWTPTVGNQEQAWSTGFNASGFLVLRNAGTTVQKAVTIRDRSTANGAAAVQWDYVGQDNQEFQYALYTDGSVTIWNRRSQKCLAVPNGDMDRGVGIIQWTCNGGPEQRWFVYPWS